MCAIKNFINNRIFLLLQERQKYPITYQQLFMKNSNTEYRKYIKHVKYLYFI